MENEPKQAPKQLVGKSEYARIRRLSRSRLSQDDMVKRLAPAMETDATGKVLIDVAKANEILDRETDTAKIRKPSTPASFAGFTEAEGQEPLPGSMDADRRENLRLKNEMARLELAREKGQTLPREGVFAATAAAGQGIREALAARNRHLVEKIRAMPDTRQALMLMDQSDREILGTVSDDFMRRIQGQIAGSGQPSTH